MTRTNFFATAAFLLAASSSPASGEDEVGRDAHLERAGSEAQVFRISVRESGVYGVTYEDLDAAGLTGPVASAGLGLTTGGEDVPIHVEDGGDGVFGPGDHLELVGERLHGEHSFFHEYSRYNAYFLHTAAPNAARMTPLAATSADGGPFAVLRANRHHEKNLLRLRLPPVPGLEADDIWYWAKLSCISRESFEYPLDLRGLAADQGPTNLRLRFRGWSKPRRHKDGSDLAHHQVEVLLNGHLLASREWNGQAPYFLEIPGVSPETLSAGENTLELRVPMRRYDNDDLLVDLVMLDWIEVDHPLDGKLDDVSQQRFFPSSAAPLARVRAARPLTAYGSDGSRVTMTGAPPWAIPRPDGNLSFFVAAELREPAAVVLDVPSDLLNGEQQADYVVIAHGSLRAAVEPLAELHRSRGLRVTVVDVQDIYDEMSHGVVHPRAIRDFLHQAWENWDPAPRFVLLVGDASWDVHNAEVHDENYADWTVRPQERDRFAKNTSYPYGEDGDVNNRDLLPTWSYASSQGHAASDNAFVDFDGDTLPELAIGRLPVVRPEEVRAIVEKTANYMLHSPAGPWRHRALFITNESPQYQKKSNELARRLANTGLEASKIYPASSETSNAEHSQRLVDAFDEGQSLIHFLGHGGRYIWRTGPPDIKKNHDLFTLEHLDLLQPSERLPVVASMTCYSAPFDHPNADSIGEKLLRLDGRGAVAVLAASWRNNPSVLWSRVLTEELTRPGTTVGEAVQRAKRRVFSPDFVATYNLLGDPALPIAQPKGEVHLEVVRDEERLQVRGTVDVEDFNGEIVLEAVDGNGDTVASLRQHLAAPSFDLALAVSGPAADAVEVVRAYAWNDTTDAAGAYEIVPVPSLEAADERRRQRFEQRRQQMEPKE